MQTIVESFANFDMYIFFHLKIYEYNLPFTQLTIKCKIELHLFEFEKIQKLDSRCLLLLGNNMR